MQIKVFVTHKNGDVAFIQGHANVVRQMEIMLQKAGARWNPNVETWDFGFYTDTPSKIIDVAA